MNRTDHLLSSATRISRWDGHREHLIVDWGSRNPIERRSLPADQRIRLLRVEGESEWQLTRAYNFAASQSSHETLLKLDADCWIDDLTYQPTPLSQGHYLRTTGGGGLNGVFLVNRADFFSVGGFNEYFRGYGYDDKDLYLRLDDLIACMSLPIGVFCTLEHGDLERVHAASIPPGREQTGRDQRSTGERLEAIARMEESKAINRELARCLPWSGDSAATNYQYLGQNQWMALQESVPSPSTEVQEQTRILGNRIYLSILLGIHERLLDMEIPAVSLGRIRRWTPLLKALAKLRISTLLWGIKLGLRIGKRWTRA
jgi:hypothetical protein